MADDKEPGIEPKINATGLPPPLGPQSVIKATMSASDTVPTSSRHKACLLSHVKDSDDLKSKTGLFTFSGFRLLSTDEYEMQHKRH